MTALVRLCVQVKKNEEQQQDVTDLSRDRLLGSVHVFRALDDAELLKVLEQLPAFLQQRKRVCASSVWE